KTTNSRKKPVLKDDKVGKELNELIKGFLEKGMASRKIRADIDIQPTVLYVWSAISGIIQVAERKKDELDESLNMNKREYLRYSFRTFYESLVRR
ncbi:MAG: hypothetical protein IKL53_00610, partial [Lachnospiraceae bacterium]|nr:hypothetical protein [Lachnospiraceae bacterium]